MTADRKDQGSDASRSDPDNADRAREDLKKHAEEGIKNAMRGDVAEGSDRHPEQDPAEGSSDVIERDLAGKDDPGGSESSKEARQEALRPTAGAQAAEPSPGDGNR